MRLRSLIIPLVPVYDTLRRSGPEVQAGVVWIVVLQVGLVGTFQADVRSGLL